MCISSSKGKVIVYSNLATDITPLEILTTRQVQLKQRHALLRADLSKIFQS